MQKLPVDMSTFSILRTSGYTYVDKTQYIYRMIMKGRRYFLSRPRRFGKSLLVSTLKELFSARQDLFGGLWIEKSDYQWKEHGVIALDFSQLHVKDIAALRHRLCMLVLDVAQKYDVLLNNFYDDPDVALKLLIGELSKRFGHVAILIDEYDSPILKSLHNHEVSVAIRNEIQQFFTVIKSLDACVDFVFITGVSSFAKAGLFSGINNLQIITLQEPYAALCGYTDQEIDQYFSEHIARWSHDKNMPFVDIREQLKMWYNGYQFGYHVPSVYNPFSVMNALHIQSFKNFWFQSGTPTFLIEVLKQQHHLFDQDDLELSEDALGIFDIGATPLATLMFQAGYLTIVDYDSDSELYRLYYPNLEVKRSLQRYLLEVFAHIDSVAAEQLSGKFRAALYKNNLEEAISLLKRLFAHVPYQLHDSKEKFYHALLMMVCVGAGMQPQAEYSTSHGRIDLILETPLYVYVIEIKFNESAQDALKQIEERRYYDRFMVQSKSIILVGLSFERGPSTFDIKYKAKQLAL